MFVEAVSELRTEGKDEETLRLKSSFGGLQLFYGAECFPEPVKIVVRCHVRELTSTCTLYL